MEPIQNPDLRHRHSGSFSTPAKQVNSLVFYAQSTTVLISRRTICVCVCAPVYTCIQHVSVCFIISYHISKEKSVMFHHMISYIKGSKHVSCCFTCSREDDKALTLEEVRPKWTQSKILISGTDIRALFRRQPSMQLHATKACSLSK